MAWTTITQPAVGDKITAAGFGDQVHDSIGEIQAWISDVDPTAPSLGFGPDWRQALLREHATPGRVTDDITTGTPTSVSGGPTTVLSGPSGGRRVLKSLLLSASAAGTATLTLAGTTIAKVTYTTPGLAVLDTCWPVANGETIQVTASGLTAVATPVYVDRADTLLDRLGMVASSSSSAQTVISSGTARTITQLWMANAGSTASTVELIRGGTTICPAMAISAGQVISLDTPFTITNSQTLQFKADGTNSVTVLAVGY